MTSPDHLARSAFFFARDERANWTKRRCRIVVDPTTKNILNLLIYMKKFLHFDWLRAVQFFFFFFFFLNSAEKS